MIDMKLLLELEKEYDNVIYDDNIKMIHVRIPKTHDTNELLKTINGIEMKMPYPLVRFNGEPESYLLTFQGEQP